MSQNDGNKLLLSFFPYTIIRSKMYYRLCQVEFPEARIYEETLNCLLYEKSTGPELELLAATTRQVKPCGSDDEDMNLSGLLISICLKPRPS